MTATNPTVRPYTPPLSDAQLRLRRALTEDRGQDIGGDGDPGAAPIRAAYLGVVALFAFKIFLALELGLADHAAWIDRMQASPALAERAAVHLVALDPVSARIAGALDRAL